MRYYDENGEPLYVQFDERQGIFNQINAYALHNIDVSLRRIAKSLETLSDAVSEPEDKEGWEHGRTV